MSDETKPCERHLKRYGATWDCMPPVNLWTCTVCGVNGGDSDEEMAEHLRADGDELPPPSTSGFWDAYCAHMVPYGDGCAVCSAKYGQSQ